MQGLYALKPWYAARLDGPRRWLVAHRVSPIAISCAGVLAGAGAGVALALVPGGPAAGLAVTGCLALRLACANLDGGVARAQSRPSARGALVNEIGDRVADLLALAGAFALSPAWLVLTAMLVSTLPSWVSLAGAAAGGGRLQGGPGGKTERAAALVLVAATGAAEVVLTVLIVLCLATTVTRVCRLVVTLDGPR